MLLEWLHYIVCYVYCSFLQPPTSAAPSLTRLLIHSKVTPIAILSHKHQSNSQEMVTEPATST